MKRPRGDRSPLSLGPVWPFSQWTMSCCRAHKRATPRVLRDPPTIRMWSDGSRAGARRSSANVRARRPLPHSESVRTRFHISHNRLWTVVAVCAVRWNSFLAAPRAISPFLISNVVTDFTRLFKTHSRRRLERSGADIFWPDLTMCSTFRLGRCSLETRL